MRSVCTTPDRRAWLGRLSLALAVSFAAVVPVMGQGVAGQDSQLPEVAAKIEVVASFSILADLARNVGSDRIHVTALVGPGGDAHVYSPSPADARVLGAAKLIVVNGLGFEGWLDRLVRASATKAVVVVASTGVTQRRSGDPGDSAAAADPHAWQAVDNVKIYVANIRDALVRIDPPGSGVYAANAAAYAARLDRLDADIKHAIATIPAGRRKVITTHDAFGYFGDAYGVAFLAEQGVSTETEASARDVARTIVLIRQQGIPALFFENIVDPRLIKRIAAETGARIGGTLFSDALTDRAGAAPTYIDMMTHNVAEIVAALH
jgi:zinc/manganese transport system substrate-binding protein